MVQQLHRPMAIPSLIQIRRGDERLSHSFRLGTRWFCQLHGTQRGVKVLAAGEIYMACPECLQTSACVLLEAAEYVPRPKLEEPAFD